MNDREHDLLATHVCMAVDKICKAEVQRQNDASYDGKAYHIDNRTKYTLAHLVQNYAATLAEDLQSFARHAKRQNINVDDVKLCARKNDKLMVKLDAFMSKHSIKSSKPLKSKAKPSTKAKTNTGKAKKQSSFNIYPETSSDDESDNENKNSQPRFKGLSSDSDSD